jgi:CXXC-20-CXXC protein
VQQSGHFVEQGGIKMPICKNCQNKWNWKQTMRKMFTLDTAMICPYCGEKQYQTRKSKRKSAFLNALVTLPLLLNILFEIPGVILLSLFPVLFFLIMSLNPFLIHLSNKEEDIISSGSK